MGNKLYWGLGVFLVLFIGFFVFLMVKNQSENRDLMDQLAEMEQLTGQIKEREALKNNPPAAREGYKMVWHDDHWHEVPIDAPDAWDDNTQSPMTKKTETTERLGYFARIYKKYGVEPPPPGYAYRMSDPGVLKLDEKGDPILYKKGEPIFDIGKGIGFAPTYEQYKRYEQLIQLWTAAQHAGANNKADQYRAEIDQLEAAAQGEIPVVTSTLAVPKHLYESAEAEANRKASQIMKQAYIDFGLGYMVDY